MTAHQGIRFAFAGRCSTEDMQDPSTSRAWQRGLAAKLVDGHGHLVEDEFFDVGLSRSTPWKRRPEAARLLRALRDPDRGFDAVVIGEFQRLFYDAQFQTTIPYFEAVGVPLWMPETNGAFDPKQDAQGFQMTILGGLSHMERNVVRRRVFNGMAATAEGGRSVMGGRTPYGYVQVVLGPHPNLRKAAEGHTLKTLAAHPVYADAVRAIFAAYLAGTGLRTIAADLDRAGVPCPSAANPTQNPGRSGNGWGYSSVRAILVNPVYTGHAVWGRTRGQDVLWDDEDSSLGHFKRQVRVDPTAYARSPGQAHPPLVSQADFDLVQAKIAVQRAIGGHGPAGGGQYAPRRAGTRNYPLAGLLVHASCGRRMTGSWNNRRTHYRCSLPPHSEVPAGGHPKTVYLPEDLVVGQVDGWLADLFSPANRDATVASLVAASRASDPQAHTRATLEASIAEADKAEANLVRAIENGLDSPIATKRMAEIAEGRDTARRALAATPARASLDQAAVERLVLAAGGLAAALGKAGAAERGRVYATLGLRLVYDEAAGSVDVEATLAPRPANGRAAMCERSVRGGT